MNISKKQLARFVLIVAAIKFFFSFFIELGNDESYYYTYAITPQLNYFDHPLLIGWLIRFSTLNLSFVNDVMLRLGPTVCCIISSVFIFKAAQKIFNAQTGWYAVALYNFSVYTGFIAGWFVLPDSVQMPFWCASLLLMATIVFEEKDRNVLQWVMLGITIGLATLSKVHGLFLWAGFGLFILLFKTKWLLNWRLYISVVVTLIFLLPILIWNINNNFITYKFHSGRVTKTQINIDSFLREITGEALYQNPIVYALIVVAIFFFIKKIIAAKATANAITEKTPYRFLFCLSLPMIFLFWAVSLFNEILPHWSGPAFIALLILTANYLSIKSNQLFSNWLKASAALVLIALIAITCLANFAPFNLGSQDRNNYGEYCPTLDISGWKNFSDNFDSLLKKDISTQAMKPNASILINNWFPACQLQLYTSTKTKLPIIAVGSLENVHQFAWLNNAQQKKLQINDDAYCIVPSNNPTNVMASYQKYFTTILQPDTINQIRGGKVVRYFYVWRLKQCLQLPPDILTE